MQARTHTRVNTHSRRICVQYVVEGSICSPQEIITANSAQHGLKSPRFHPKLSNPSLAAFPHPLLSLHPILLLLLPFLFFISFPTTNLLFRRALQCSGSSKSLFLHLSSVPHPFCFTSSSFHLLSLLWGPNSRGHFHPLTSFTQSSLSPPGPHLLSASRLTPLPPSLIF